MTKVVHVLACSPTSVIARRRSMSVHCSQCAVRQAYAVRERADNITLPARAPRAARGSRSVWRTVMRRCETTAACTLHPCRSGHL